MAKAREANGAITDGTFFEVAKTEFNVTDPRASTPLERSPSGGADGADRRRLWNLRREASSVSARGSGFHR